MTTELRARGRTVSDGPGGQRAPEQHREHVVRRLLASGLSAQTLLTLLPDFRPVVQRVLHRD